MNLHTPLLPQFHSSITHRLRLAAVLLGSLLWIVSAADAQQPLELQDGDRVVWIGSEFTEQSIKHNFVEAALTSRWPDRRITFRNLGWAGDDPTAVARGYFNGAAEGYPRLIEELTRLKPTVVFIEYGETSAYAGEAGFPAFTDQMKRLISDVKKLTDRITLVSPPAAEKLPAPVRDPAETNANRQAISAILKQLAADEKLEFIDILTPLQAELNSENADRLTLDSIRYNSAGYAAAAEATLNAIGVSGFSRESTNAELLELIRVKNDLYFHQYRPQNETYIRGFRKHEQGQNAKDIAAFEPLIAEAEARIADYVQGKPIPKMAPLPPKDLTFTPKTAQEQKESFKVAPGLEVTPFASEPMVMNPIAINFDSRGRLWVASSPIYPQIRPGAQPTDEIIVLEDTDGDNVADKKTVFAGGLLIPTAVLPDERGGAYVANSTELLHLIDNDGDGVADERRVILSGFGTEDTHHILHTFRWTPDALLSFNQSIYIHSHVETPYGVEKMMGSGFWRYRPETARANTVAFGLVNPWGYVFDNWGQSFATDGAGGHGINYIFPGAAYLTAVGFNRILEGMNPGQPKMCGLEIITGNHFSQEYQGSLVTADFRGNRVVRFKLSEEGSGYISRQTEDILTSSDSAFRPIDQKIGPDGALYIADWYNPIINHGEVDFRDPRRDDRHGRIWRVTQTGQSLAPRPAIADESVENLVKLFEHPEQTVRHLARVHLRFKDHAEVSAAVQNWFGALDTQDPLYEQRRLEALWTYQAIAQVPTDFLLSGLKSADHHVRAASIRVLSQGTQENYGLPADFDVLPLLAEAVKDAHPQVRLEAVNALRVIPSPQSAVLALQVLNQPMDGFLDFALWSTIRTLEPQWGPQVANGTAEFSGNLPELLFALRAVDSPASLPVLMNLLTSNNVPADKLGEVLALITKFAGPDEARVLFDRALANESERGELLGHLVALADRRRVVPAGDLSALESLLPAPQAVYLVGFWKQEAHVPTLISLVSDNAVEFGTREAALRSLSELKNREALEAIVANTELPFPIRRRAAGVLLNVDTAVAVKNAVDLIQVATPDDLAEIDAVIGDIVARGDGPDHLANALNGVQLSESISQAALRRATSVGQRGEKLATTIRSASGMSVEPRVYSPEEIQRILSRVDIAGNAANGERIYRRKELLCMSCHSIGGAGGLAGPDILSLGASSPVDYILDSLINPSAKIKEGYHTNTIALEDGRVVSGVVVREGDTEIVLRDAQNKEMVIPVAEVDERIMSPNSLMPPELVSRLNNEELLDLVVFLSSLGKEGQYKVPQNRYIRRWMAQDQGQLISMVDGGLPMDDCPGGPISFEVEVTTPGLIGLKLRNPETLKLLWQENAIEPEGDIYTVELPAGRHRLTIEPATGRLAPLFVEVIDLEGSAGRAEPANR
ncbi:PVC-type heme-binding CxxCH protein [Planctomicrobium sp. SH668]|uniref:PVC-type heme-binding CxxCH protein n=1 Tax=Planctomicrobium sp. SH668 TaxID=3448126 RepID=UPI003F5AFE87